MVDRRQFLVLTGSSLLACVSTTAGEAESEDPFDKGYVPPSTEELARQFEKERLAAEAERKRLVAHISSLKADEKITFVDERGRMIRQVTKESGDFRVILEALGKSVEFTEQSEAEEICTFSTPGMEKEKISAKILFPSTGQTVGKVELLRIYINGEEGYEFALDCGKAPEMQRLWMELLAASRRK